MINNFLQSQKLTFHEFLQSLYSTAWAIKNQKDSQRLHTLGKEMGIIDENLRVSCVDHFLTKIKVTS